MSGTIRSRTEAQRDRHREKFGIPYSADAKPRSLNQCTCGKRWPCPDRVAADDTLTDLDNATEPGRWWVNGGGVSSADYRCRIIPDPKPGEPNPWASPWAIPDPDSRGAA